MMDVYLVSEPEVLLVFALVLYVQGHVLTLSACFEWELHIWFVFPGVCYKHVAMCQVVCVNIISFYSCLILCNVVSKPEWCCCSVRWELFSVICSSLTKMTVHWQLQLTWLILILIQIWNCFQFLMDFIVIDLHMTENPCGLTWQRPPWWRSHFHFFLLVLHIKGHFQQIQKSELISVLETMNKYGNWNK